MKTFLIALGLIAGVSSAQAITIDKSHDTLIIKGDIKVGDSLLLRDVLEANKNIKTIELSSDGGEIAAAVPLARLIRDHKLNTLVDGRKDGCFSACMALFLAGVKRTYLTKGMHNERDDPELGLGFHQSSVTEDVVFTAKGIKFNHTVDSPAGNGEMNYLYNEFGCPNAYQFMFKAKWYSMYVLSSKEAVDNGIVN